jgi:hypothetical protein
VPKAEARDLRQRTARQRLPSSTFGCGTHGDRHCGAHWARRAADPTHNQTQPTKPPLEPSTCSTWSYEVSQRRGRHSQPDRDSSIPTAAAGRTRPIQSSREGINALICRQKALNGVRASPSVHQLACCEACPCSAAPHAARLRMAPPALSRKVPARLPTRKEGRRSGGSMSGSAQP